MTDIFQEIHDFINSTPNEESKLLADEEIQTVITSLALSRGDDGFDEDEAVKVVRWAEMAVINQDLLGLILRGLVDINIIDDELVFKARGPIDGG